MNIDWIDANLPFSTPDPDWFSDQLVELGILPPNLRDEEVALFGASREGLWVKYGDLIEKVRNYDALELDSKLDAMGLNPYRDSDEWNHEHDRLLGDWLAEHPSHLEAWEAQETREKIRVWRLTHPAQVSYQQRWDALDKERTKTTFEGRDLNKPGTLIELADKSRHLIGSINPYGGVCDDCTKFDGDAIVVRYAVLVDWQALSGSDKAPEES